MTQDALKKIVVVDDDHEIRTLLTEYLTLNRFDVAAFESGEAFLDSARAHLEADIAILDVMLPGMTGFDVCRELRGFSRMPVIMLTANSDEMDRIVGLELGADDYLAKPFNPRELLARIRAVLRRMEPAPEPHGKVRARRFVRFAGFELDMTSRRLWTRAGDTGALTGADYHLLNLFLSQPGETLTREFIAEQTRGRDNLPMDRFVDVHISRLRQRLNEDAKAPSIIQTVRGKGYLLACTVEHSDQASLVEHA
jgi:two-component system OmpR family response regulator